MLDCPDDIYISKSRGTVPKSYFNRVTCAPPPPWRTFSALNLMVFTTELKLLIIKIYSFFFLLSPIILIKHSELKQGHREVARRDR